MLNFVRRNHWIWLGPVVAFVGAVSYFLYFVRFPVLRDFPWVNLPLTVLGALLSFAGLWIAWRRPRDHYGRLWKRAVSVLGFALSLGLVSLFVWYIFDLSYRLPDPPSLAGQTAPEFALASALAKTEGGTVHLSDYRGQKILLVFYRGRW